MGCYSGPSGVDPGQERLPDAMAAPHGRILFAGEATARTGASTVDGAWLTGIREAKRLLGVPAVDLVGPGDRVGGDGPPTGSWILPRRAPFRGQPKSPRRHRRRGGGQLWGLISASLLAVPGTSAEYFVGGSVIYTRTAKEALFPGIETAKDMRGTTEGWATWLAARHTTAWAPPGASVRAVPPADRTPTAIPPVARVVHRRRPW